MKKFLSFIAVSILFMSNVSAQTIEIPYDEFYTDGTTSSLGTVNVEIPDELTFKTEDTEGTGVTLDYWYEADGGKVLDGYDCGLYLSAFIPTNEEIESPFEATITLTLPSKYDQEDFKIMYSGKEVEVTHNEDGTITFVAMVGTDFNGSFDKYFNLFNGSIFLKEVNNNTSTDSILTNKVEYEAYVDLGEDEDRVDFKLPDNAKIIVTTEEDVISKIFPSGYENPNKSMFLIGSMSLVVDVKVEGYTKDTLPVNISLPIPSNYDASLTTIKLVDGTVIKPTSVKDGMADFTTYLTKASWSDSRYWTNHASISFVKATNVSDSTISTDSSSAVETTIDTENALPNGSSLSVKAVEISTTLKESETNLKKVFDISVLDTSGTIIEVKDNKMTITMNLDEELKNFNKYEVVYIKDSKIVERIPATVEDGKISFTTTHLSEYGIVAYNENQNSNENNPQTLDNISCFITLGSISLIGLLSASLYLRKKIN